MEKYKFVNGTAYHNETDIAVINALEYAREYHINIKITYGDTKTGRNWMEEHEVYGHVGRSTGKIKIPLLVNHLAYGGYHLLDHCVIRIRDTQNGRILYQHPKYTLPEIQITQGDMPEYPFNTVVNGVLYGRHRTRRSAQICAAKLP